jgi:hypothetical protein
MMPKVGWERKTRSGSAHVVDDERPWQAARRWVVGERQGGKVAGGAITSTRLRLLSHGQVEAGLSLSGFTYSLFSSSLAIPFFCICLALLTD